MRLSRACLLGVIVVLGGAAAGCGTSIPPPAALPAPSPTPPVIATSAPATAQSLVTLSTPAPAAAQQIPVSVPAVAGYSGTVALPVPSTLPAGAAVDTTTSNTAIDAGSGVPLLLAALRAPKATAVVDPSVITVLLYFKIVANVTVVFPNAPAVTLTVPSSSIAPNTAYYLAEYDPLHASLGWQRGFEGPATVSGTTLTFLVPNPAAALTLAAQSPVYFGLYAVSTNAATPTPAPASTPGPTPTPIPPFTLSNTTLSLLSAGATGTVTIGDPSSYSGTYAVASSATAIATVAIDGKTLIVAGVAPGTATISIGDSQGRTAQVTVQVTTTTLPLQ